MLVAGLLAASALLADTPTQILEGYAVQARIEDPGFTAFSAEHGEAFYRAPHVIKGAGGLELFVVSSEGSALLGPRAPHRHSMPGLPRHQRLGAP